MEITKTNNLQKTLKYFLVIFLGTILLTLSAKNKIPFYPVPMTMQTFLVIFFGISFGYKIIPNWFLIATLSFIPLYKP